MARLGELDQRRNTTTAESQATSCETTDNHCGKMDSSQGGKDDIQRGSNSSVEGEVQVSSTGRIGSKEDNNTRMPCRVRVASDPGMSMRPAP